MVVKKDFRSENILSNNKKMEMDVVLYTFASSIVLMQHVFYDEVSSRFEQTLFCYPIINMSESVSVMQNCEII